MKEIFNFTLMFFVGISLVLCVISTDLVYAESVPNRSTSGYETTINALAEDVRDGMVERKKTIVVMYKMKSSELSNDNWFPSLCSKVINKAFEHTGVPEEGDSLKFCVKGYDSKASYFTVSNYSYITLTFTMSYYTTSSQEAKLDSKINQLDLEGSSDYQTVKNIYNYICDNVEYNYKKDSLKYTAYNAAVNKSAVCQGYSVLFYRLALENGIDARVIAGKGRNNTHVWNIVEIEGKYYYLDSTWDAGDDNYDYFLKGYNNFSDHSCNSEYKTSGFKSEYPVSSSNFKCSTHKWNSSYTIDKKATYAEAGTKSIHCSKCGCKKTSSITTIPKLTCKLKGPSSLKASLTTYYGSAAGYDDLKVTWGAVTGAKGYYVKYRKLNADTWYGKYTVNKYVYLKDLTDGAKYEIRVYPYVTENGTKYKSSNYTTVTSCYTLKKTNITKVSKSLTGVITFTWCGIEGESGYQLYRAKSSDGQYSKVTTVKVTDKQTTSVKVEAEKGVSYWYKVRAYKSLGDGKYIYGPWSEKVKYTR